MMAYSGHIMTLANSIIGVGILAMPFCFQKCGIILSVLLLIISNWITRISCHYLIKASLLTRRKSFEFLGFHAFGASGKLLAELCIIGYLFGTSITYFVVMGDLGPQIASKMLSLNIADFPHLRTWVMISVTLFCILPLAMLKNVDSLSTICAASIGFYVCLVLKIVLESGEHIMAHDWVNMVEYWRPAGILQCLPIFSMALSCQMQLFEVFESINNQSVEKLNGIVRNATWICTFVYIAVGFFGYVAFCTQTFSGNILMNFSPSFGSDVIKIGFVISVAFSFPLVVFPCRASLYSLLYRKGHTDNTGYIPETRFKVITTCLVGCALCIALIIPSVELIIGLVGSTIGVAICIMFPALCFRKIVKKDSTERALAQFIYVGGFCLMILGTVANLNAIDERHSGAHLHVADEFADTIPVRPTEKISAVTMNAALLFQPHKDERYDDLQIKKQDRENKPEAVMNATPVQSIPFPIDNIPQQERKSKQSINADKEDNSLSVEMKKHDEEHNKKQYLEHPTPLDVKPLQLEISNLSAPQQQNIHAQSHLDQKNLKQSQETQQQTIDKDAIKNDEDIAAEELKNGQKSSKSKNDVALKETQKELKQTKELLERTVDQLKQELAKQNEETKNLVAEKLEKVVQKVEQIEKKVIQNESEQSPIMENKESINTLSQNSENQPKESAVIPKSKMDESKSIDIKQTAKERPPLLSILSEHPVKGVADENIHKQQEVYEPLSYKTGELIEDVKNGSKVEQSLPLPLAVLFNASNIKPSNNSNVHVRDVPDKTLNNFQHAAHNTNATINVDTENSPLLKLVPVPNEKEKDNVEAIRRDILNLSSEKLKEFPFLALSASDIENDSNTATTNAQHLRKKRSIMPAHSNSIEIQAIDSKLHSNNCLPEPKVEELIVHGGISNTIDFKMQNIGRELRSVNDDYEMKN